MKYLVLASVVCALAAVLDAFCHVSPMKAGCKDDVDDTWHELGSTWINSDCMNCSCSGGCCSTFFIPRSFPDDCVSVFDAKACKYNVTKKDDPSVECPIYGGAGK